MATAAEAVTITDQSEAVIGEASSESEGGSIGSGDQPESRRDHAKKSDTVGQSFHVDYGDDRIERATDERLIDRLGLFDRPEGGRSGRYSVSLDLENEDSDVEFRSHYHDGILIRTADSAAMAGECAQA